MRVLSTITRVLCSCVICCLTMGNCCAYSDADETSVKWEVRVLREFDPVYCKTADLMLELRKESGERFGFRASLDRLDIVRRRQTWTLPPLHGKYDLVATYTDCNGERKETPKIDVLVGAEEAERRIVVIPRGGSATFEVQFLSLITTKFDNGVIQLVSDVPMTLRNGGKTVLERCMPEVGLEVRVGNEWIGEEVLRWPTEVERIEPGHDVELVATSPIVLLLKSDDKVPVRSRLVVRLKPTQLSSLDLGWDERSPKPFRLGPCCDMYYVDLPTWWVEVSELVEINWDDEGVDRAKLRSTRKQIRNLAVPILNAYREEFGSYPVPSQSVSDLGELKAMLSLETGDALPAADAWGQPLKYWSDGSTIMIASAGGDGQWDVDYVGLTETNNSPESLFATVCTSGVNRDVIFVQNNFCVWSKYVAGR